VVEVDEFAFEIHLGFLLELVDHLCALLVLLGHVFDADFDVAE